MLPQLAASLLSGQGGNGGLLGSNSGGGFLSGLTDGGGDEPTSATATSGGPFTSGAISFGSALDTKTILVIGAIVLVALFLWKK